MKTAAAIKNLLAVPIVHRPTESQSSYKHQKTPTTQQKNRTKGS